MMMPICLFIALAINSALGAQPLAPPKSPCPRVFKFAPNYHNALTRGRNTSASITIEKPKDANHIKLLISMQTRSPTLEPLRENMSRNNIIKVNLVSSEDDMLNKQVSHLKYRVDFAPNKEKVIPHPYEITVNDKIICQGKKVKEGTHFRLQYEHDLPEIPVYETDPTDDYEY